MMKIYLFNRKIEKEIPKNLKIENRPFINGEFYLPKKVGLIKKKL